MLCAQRSNHLVEKCMFAVPSLNTHTGALSAYKENGDESLCLDMLVVSFLQESGWIFEF
jgi:hypothetical protein